MASESYGVWFFYLRFWWWTAKSWWKSRRPRLDMIEEDHLKKTQKGSFTFGCSLYSVSSFIVFYFGITFLLLQTCHSTIVLAVKYASRTNKHYIRIESRFPESFLVSPSSSTRTHHTLIHNGDSQWHCRHGQDLSLHIRVSGRGTRLIDPKDCTTARYWLVA